MEIHDPDGFKNELQSRMAKFCDEIQGIWNEIGVNESCQSDRAQEAMTLLEQICLGMINEEKSNLHKLKESVKLARKDIEEITRALKLHGVDEPQQLPLMQLEAFLKSEADKLRVMKKERMDQLEKLMSTATELSKELGEKFTCTVKPGEIPADCELKYLAQDVERLKFLKIERVSQAEELMNDIKLLYNELEESWQDLSLSKHLLSCDVSNLLTLASIKDLQRLKEQLSQKQEALEQRSRSLREQLESMYTRLDLQMLQLQQFLHRHLTSKPSDLVALENELEKCFELRKSNIEKFVTNCRRELEQYWQCLYITEERKQELFKPFFSTNYSETLLELHEAELEKTKERYEKSRPILDLFNQYNEVWSEYVEIERKANDPARLLARGRGKGLLQEQRERREVEKKLPKLEEKLTVAVDKWELEEAEAFIVCDHQIMDFISQQKEELSQEKEALKRAKHEEKEREKQQEIRFGTAAVKRGAGAMTNGAAYGAHKTPKKSKIGTTLINATNSNQCMKTTISSGSNKSSRNILISASKSAKSSSSQQPVMKAAMHAPLMGHKAPVGILLRQPNFGIQSGPLRGLGGVVVNKPSALPVNPAQKAKRRSLAQLNKKKAEPAPPSKLSKENVATCEAMGRKDVAEKNTREVRRSRRIHNLNESKRSDGVAALSSVSHLANLHEQVDFSVLNETYSTFSNKISGDLASSMLMQHHHSNN